MAETYIDMYQIQNFASSTFHYNPRFISYSIATPFFHILSLGQKPSNSYSEYISACDDYYKINLYENEKFILPCRWMISYSYVTHYAVA